MNFKKPRDKKNNFLNCKKWKKLQKSRAFSTQTAAAFSMRTKSAFKGSSNFSRIFLATIFIAIFSGCSVDYGTVSESEEFVPELMLDDARFSRIENGQTTAQVSSERLEEFKGSGKVLAQKIQFETKNSDGETTATGKAGLMCADTDAELYEFFDGIEIRSETHNVRISGESLKWNGRTEQLTGERGKEITIEKDGVSLSGQDFSASAVSEQFSFGAEVHGTYIDKEKDEEAEESANPDS